MIEQQGIRPVVLLLADAGYKSYGALIQTSRQLADGKPALVRAFVAATAKGWRDYLSGNAAPGDTLIKRHNPEMTDALLAYGRAKMNRYRIVLSGDARRSGIGAMSDARWADFFKTMSSQGLYPKGMNWRTAYTTRFLEPARPDR